MMPLVSVIVPVYNTEMYLDRCIRSILSQTYSAFELILVDDGSTDGSLDVLKKYSDDKRVKVYSKSNGGAADTRNFGLTKASPDSKFTVFVDSDDSIEPQYIEELVKGERGCDCVVSNMRDIYGSREVVGEFVNKDQKCSDIFQNTTFLSLFHTGILNSSCNKLYKTEIIRQNNLSFDLDLYNEDISFNVEYFTHCRSVSLVNQPLYNYHHRTGSITSAPPKRAVTDYITLQKRMYAIIPADLHDYVDDFVSYQYFGFLLRLLQAGDDATIKRHLKDKYVARSLKAHKSKSMGEWLQYTIMRFSMLKLYRKVFSPS